MLWALGDPLSFAVLVVAFLLAVTLHGLVATLVAARTRSGGLRPAGAAPGRAGSAAPFDPRGYLDPFGTIAAAIAGVGWGRPVGRVDRRRRGALVALTVLPGLVVLLAGLALLAGFTARTGGTLGGGASVLLRDGAGPVGSLDARALLLGGLMLVYVGLLSLVPLPPLDGGRLLFALAPRSPGWLRAEHLLVEQNYGVGLLLLLLLPLGGSQTLMLRLLDVFAAPLLRVVTGG